MDIQPWYLQYLQYLQEENSPPELRFNSLLVAAPGGSVLTPAALLQLLRVHQQVAALVTAESALSWDQVCYTIPVISLHNNDDLPGPGPGLCEAPWLAPCYPEPWCSLQEAVTSSACLEQSILELWGYEEAVYRQLTQEDILDKVNEDNLTRNDQAHNNTNMENR